MHVDKTRGLESHIKLPIDIIARFVAISQHKCLRRTTAHAACSLGLRTRRLWPRKLQSQHIGIREAGIHGVRYEVTKRTVELVRA